MEWVVEKSGHYQICPCQYHTEAAPHTYDVNGQCTVCGFLDHTCAPSGEVEQDETYHGFVCHCGEWIWEQHTYRYEDVKFNEREHYNACEACGYRTNVEAHGFVNGFILYPCCNKGECNYQAPVSLGLEFERNGDEYTLIGAGDCRDTNLVIPDTYNGRPVTAIGPSAFEGNTKMERILIPQSVQSIGSSAFAGCTSLKAVFIPHGVTVIRDNTFASCTSLVVVDIPQSVKSIEMFAFSGCTALESVSYQFYLDPTDERVLRLYCTEIGDNAFYQCKALASKLEFSWESHIGSGAFSGCTSIKEIDISSVYTVGGNAFSGCTSLETVVAFRDINDGYGFDIATFSNCSALKKLTMRNSADQCAEFFACSPVDEDMGLSWYDGTPDFTVDFTEHIDGTDQWRVLESKTISEIYGDLNANNES